MATLSATDWLFADGLLEQGESVVIAVSGGADSMVLLELLATLREKRDLELRALHVNYGLRGRASDLDAELVAKRCKELDIFLTIHHAAELSSDTSNLEERARDIRHAALRREAQAVGATAIALGHTRDDSAETILMRLLRGSGVTGLCGLAARDGLYVRPLVYMRRTAIRQYAQTHAIEYRDDASNEDPRFVRNRIRRELIPLLESRFNAGIVNTLTTSAALLRDDEAFLEQMTQSLYKQLVKESQQKNEACHLSLASTELLQLPKALQRRLIRAMIKAAKLNVGLKVRAGHSVALNAALTRLSQDGAGVEFPLGDGLTLRRLRGTVSITFLAAEQQVNR